MIDTLKLSTFDTFENQTAKVNWLHVHHLLFKVFFSKKSTKVVSKVITGQKEKILETGTVESQAA